MMKPYSFSVREVSVARGEQRIFGKLYVPQREGKCPAVICSHGYMGVHSDFDDECEQFAKNGILAFAYDFCGGSNASKSSGKTTEMSVLTEREDLLAVLDYIKALEQTDAQNLFLLGASQGGFVSALSAQERADAIRGLVLIYPAFCIPDDWRRKYPNTDDMPEVVNFWGTNLGRRYLLDVCGLDPYRTIGAFDKDVLIIHGDQDPVVPLSYSERAKETYRHAQLVVFPGEGHGFSPEKRKEAADLALRFVQERASMHKIN